MTAGGGGPGPPPGGGRGLGPRPGGGGGPKTRRGGATPRGPAGGGRVCGADAEAVGSVLHDLLESPGTGRVGSTSIGAKRARVESCVAPAGRRRVIATPG